ncbi:hypothetical protein B0H19DRAFT_1077262 [Mycena capillaripes]|nr:hypothetical protein B0H19DRAFT_1077262 [Mycena capillaripes]
MTLNVSVAFEIQCVALFPWCDRVALIPWGVRGQMVQTVYCLLSSGEISSRKREPYYKHSYVGITLPLGFDLHRYIMHINREITHFQGSFWPLPRRLSDAAFKEAEPPTEWLCYMQLNPDGFHCIKDIWCVKAGWQAGPAVQLR